MPKMGLRIGLDRINFMIKPKQAFNPLLLGDLNLWLDASDGLATDVEGLTPVINDSEKIARWSDKSGKDNHLTQSILANRPTYKKNILNSKDVVSFDQPSIEYLKRSTSHTVDPGSNATIVIVSKSDTVAAAYGGVLFGFKTGVGYVCRNVPGSKLPRFTKNGVGNYNGIIPSWTKDEYTIVTYRWDGSDVEYFVNGESRSKTSNATPTKTGVSDINVGSTGIAGETFGGEIAEMFVYNESISNENLATIDNFLSNKYGLRKSPTNAIDFQITPTYDGSGVAIHPDVLYFENGWNGYKYWLAMTPYAGQDATLENPSMLVSNDGQTWEVPTGLTNPIIPYPGVGMFNSDTDLTMSPDGLTMYMVYREFSTLEKIFLISSTDGINWTLPTLILEGDVSSVTQMLSPSIIWDGSQYVMYTGDSSQVSFRDVAFRRTCPTIDGTWSSRIPTVMSEDFGINHVCVKLIDGVYYMVTTNTIGPGKFGNYLAKSTDGINFDYDWGFAIFPSENPKWDSRQIYRATISGKGKNLEIWYSAYLGSNSHIGYATFNAV